MQSNDYNPIVDYRNENYKEIVGILIESMEGKFIEREELIRLSLLFFFAEENLFLIGRPGVGKTYFSKIIASLVKDSRFWEMQFSQGTKEEDLFDSDVEDEKSIAKAHYLFFDEMYKATAHLLNKFLSFLNEGYITIQGSAYEVERRLVFGASNELPNVVDLNAFTDRFLGIMEVKRIQLRENKQRFIQKDFDRSKELPRYFTFDEIDYIKEEAAKVKISEEFEHLYLNLMDRTVAEGLKCSDRKYGYAIEVLKMSAFLNNRNYLNNSDIFIMKDIAWVDYIERANLRRILFELMFGNTVDVQDKLRIVKAEVEKIISIKDSDYKDILEYKFEFVSKQKELIFEAKKEEIARVLFALNTQLDKLLEIIQNYENVRKTEQEVNENIFLIGIKNKVYTPDIVMLMNTLYNVIKDNRNECEDWIISNRILYNYEEKHYD